MSPFSLRRLLSRKSQHSNRPSSKAVRAGRIPLHLERLEDRVVLTDYSGTLANGLMISGTNNHIVGDATVAAGATVTVQAGATVQFNTGTNLTVAGTLNAAGTAALPIVFTSYRDGAGAGNGDWGAITFTSTSVGSVLDQTEVRYGGYSSGTTLAGEVIDSGPLTLTNSVIRNAYGAGLRVIGSTPTVTGDTFKDNNGGAITTDLAAHPSITTATFTNNSTNGLVLDSGTLAASNAWDNAGVVYRLSGDVTVAAGVTLTVAAGQVVKSAGSNLTVNGTLTAAGTAAQPIIFTSYRDDSAGGDTNNDGVSSGANFDWGAVTLTATSLANVLEHADVRYGGYIGGTTLAGEVIDSGPLTLTNSVIRNAYGAGLRVISSTPTVTGDTFKDNNGAAITADLAAHPSITTATFTTNGTNGLVLDAGTLAASNAWDNAGVVYRLSGDVTVAAGVTLTVGAGQVVKSAGSNLTVNGTLNAAGTAALPIVFTSYRDDSAGGDTNNDGVSSGANFDWGAITLTASSLANVLDHADVRYGGYIGGTTLAGEVIDSGPLAFTNSVVRNANGAGLRLNGTTPTLSGDTFKDNAGAAITADLAAHPSVSAVTLTNNGTNGLVLDTGTLAANNAWDNAAIVYRLSGDVTVAAGVTLTVGAGQVVKSAGSNLTVNGTLNATGTAALPIVFTSYRDDSAGGDTNNDGASSGANFDWGAITLTATSLASVLNYADVRYGGYIGGTTLAGEVIDSGPLAFTNSVVRNANGAGLRLNGTTPTLTGDTFKDNAGAAITADLAAHPSITTATFTNNSTNGLILDAGTLAASNAWDNAGIVYRLSGDVTVAAGVTLTVGAGQVVKSAGSNLTVNGTLNATGTAALPVVFTSYRDDTAGGDTNNDGVSSGASFDWGAITIGSGSTGSVLNYADIRYGGYIGGTTLAGEVIDSGPLALTNSVVRNANGAGLRLNGTTPTLSGDTFKDNAGAAITADLAAHPTIGGVPILTNNSTNGLVLDSGTLAANNAWDNAGIVYRLSGDVTVAAGVTLTVGAGQVVKSNGSGLIVNGTLTAAGTAAQPVVFTSYRDDSAGGDTNNDGASSGSSFDWGAITIGSGSTGSVLNYADVRYGGYIGGTTLAGEVIDSGPLTLTNSTLRNAYGGGLRVIGSTPTLTGDTFTSNGGAAISIDLASDPHTSTITATGNTVNGIVADAGTLPANLSWTGADVVYSLAGNVVIPAGLTLTIGPSTTFGPSNTGNFTGAGTLVNQGTILKTADAGTMTVAPAVVNTGTVRVENGTLNLTGALTSNGSGIIAGKSPGKISIAGSLGGTTKNANQFAPLAAVTLNGSGTAAAPQTLEVMGQDLGNVATGFTNNFVYYSLALANNTYVKLVDAAHNSIAAGAEALYVDNLIVPSGTTLDLNGLHAYARISQINGTVVGGSVGSVGTGGPLALNIAASGTLAAGTTDDWTFFARANQAVTLTVETGSAGSPAPLSPTVSYAQLTLLDGNTTLGTASNTQAGAEVTLAGAIVPASGYLVSSVEKMYHVHVQAPSAQPNSAGNYVITAWDATNRVTPLNLNQTTYGTIDTPFRVDSWTFSATAGQLVQFKLINTSNASVVFDLTGPSGYTAFTSATASSGVLTLPNTGSYALTVHTLANQTGSYAFQMVQTVVAPLILETPLGLTVAGGAQSQLFQLTVAQPGQLRITLQDPNAADRNEVYVTQGSVPTRGNAQFTFTTAASANQQLLIPTVAPGTYYILVYTEAAPSAGSVTLTANEAGVFLTAVTPDHAGNGADATLTLTGVGFDNTAVVSLVASGGTVFAANAVSVDLPTRITATFSAGAVPAGVYSVKVTQGSSVATLAGAFTMVAGGKAVLETHLVVPGYMGYHIPAVLYIEYRNTGDVAMPAPLLILKPTQDHADGTTTSKALLTLDPALANAGYWSSALPAGFSNSVEVLGSGATPGVLQPGESGRVPVYYAGWQQPWDFSYPAFHYQVSPIQADDPTPLDWNALGSKLPPGGIDPTAWGAIRANVGAINGTTVGSYVATLDRNAAYLGQLGENVTDVGQLLAFEFAQADGLGVYAQLADAVDSQVQAPGLALTFSRTFSATISGRYQLGPLGRGWSWDDGWFATLAVAADGTVAIAGPDGSERVFQPDSRGGYFSQTGDSGTLTAAGGKFTVQEPNGRVTGFRADGNVDYVADLNGNRITAGYTAGLLTSLTHSSGQTLTIAYNAAGRIIGVTDPVGRLTTYAYDASNEHLLSVTAFDGQITSYTYSLGNGAATDHALLSIANRDGTHVFFSYDTKGRLQDTHLDNNAEDIQFTYSSPGAVTATNLAGGQSTNYFDYRGLVVKQDDPLHRVTYSTYDSKFNLTQLIDPAGQTFTYTYDAQGHAIKSIDPVGNTTQFTYSGPFGKLASVTDPKGNAIQYGYDSKGNPISTTFTDGSVEQFAYDPVGNILSSTNRGGQVTQYSYDTAGRLLSKTFADASKVTYVYDTHGNLTSATDANGTTTLVYDGKDRLQQITYPGSRVLNYLYDAAGRRTQMSDQTGFTVNYTYDGTGLLSGLTDSSGNSIVAYAYYPDGQLQRTDNANHTYTTYQYDLAGQLLHLINFAPDNSIGSRFDYTYDALGRAATMTTLDGQWVYTYDADGQLTHAVFTSNNPATLPNQDLKYNYDAAGNRTSTVKNGVTTVYTTNNLNQYTAVGTATFSYDADGNLIRKTDAGITTSYSYDPLNQLSAVAAPGDNWAYQHDPFGNLVATTHNGQTARYAIDLGGLGDIVGQYDGTGGLQAHYTHGLGLTSRVDSANLAAFYNFDATGNTVALTNTTGAVVNSYRYLPHGAALSSTETIANPFQFGGEFGVQTGANGLVSMRARSYDTATGRFIQMDPLGIAGGLNLYAYTRNDPINKIDPSGLAANLLAQGEVVLKLAELFQEAYGFKVPPPVFWAGPKFLFEQLLARGVPLERISQIPGVRSVLGHEFRQIASLKLLTQGSASVAADAAPGFLSRAGGFILKKVGIVGTAVTVYQVSHAAGTAINNHVLSENTKEIIGDTVEGIWAQGERGVQWIKSWFGGKKPDYSNLIGSHDPNDKIGPSGFGTGGFISATPAPLSYRIDFENDPTATAPAQRVTVTDNLDPNFDLNSFALTDVGFGDTLLTIPAGSQHYQTTVDVTENGKTFQVQIELGLRSDTRQVYATFQSIDPNTQLPPDVLTGFLPPEDNTGRGMGHFSYVVKLKPNLPTGTSIQNVALIQFDGNPIIATNQADPHDPSKGVDATKQDLNTIDAGTPTSSVTALPGVSLGSFTVAWSGSDDAGGSGVAVYDVFVSDNGAAFTPFLTTTTQTSTTFNGVNSHTYAFYSIATDNVGHREATPAAAQATTTVDTVAPTVATVNSTTPNGTYGVGAAINVTVAFTKVVTLTGGNLTINLNDGGVVTVAPFTNSATASGTYTVAAGQAANPLDTASPLVLAAGATLKDAVGNNALLSIPPGKSLKDNKNLVVFTAPAANGQLTFSAAAYSFDEKNGTATLTVNRAAGTGGAVTVQYDVSVASSLLTKYQAVPGTDFTGALHGTVTFNPGDAQKTITFTVTQDNLVEENKSFIVTLSQPTGGASLGSQTTTTVTILDDNLPVVPNATPKLTTLQKAGIGFGTSDEHYQQFVRSAYDHYLRRKPSDGEVAYWVGLMKAYQNDHTVGLKQEQIEAGFIDSKEYIGRFGTVGKAWVDGIYADLLGRAPDPSGESYWVGQLAKGVDPTLVALGFTTSLERLQNRVSATYLTLLERPADAGGLAYWVNIFNTGGTTEDINSGFVGSVEYYNKANGAAGNPARWVREAYLDVLFRAAKLDELKYWENFLNG